MGITTYLGAPIRMGNDFFGTLCFTDQQSREEPFTDADKAFLQIMARWLGSELQRQRDEEILKETNLALTNAMPGISQIAPDGHYTQVNALYAKMVGYEPYELINKNWQTTLHSNDLALALKSHEEMLQGGKAEFEAKGIRKDGSDFYKHVLLVKRIDEQGQHSGHHCFMRDITERKVIEDSLRIIAEAASTLKGLNFICFLIKNLASCLNVKYAFMTECEDKAPKKLRTLSFWNGTTFGENFEYSILGTPCEVVMKGELCLYTKNVQQHFPNDQDLKVLGVESYIGYPLFSQSGELFGHLVAMDSKPLAESLPVETIIKLFAARAAAELERDKAETQLREAYEQTREMSARLETAEESERKRIARELHDEFGQMLTGLKFDLSWVQRRLSEQPSLAPYTAILDKTRSMTTLTDHLIQMVRRIATSLRPSILDDLGLVPALEWHTKDFQQRTGIKCIFSHHLERYSDTIEGEHATALFRIAQELFTNVLRHANASEIKLNLRKENAAIVLDVIDNGRGISQEEIRQSTSLGLRGINERVAPFNGEFRIIGETGKGTIASIFIPYPITMTKDDYASNLNS